MSTLPNVDMGTASYAVLHLPDILEPILLHLAAREILLSQRVSRAFHQTIQGSIRLRRKIFLEPDWQLESRRFDAYAAYNRPGEKPQNNRMLLRAFPENYPTVSLVIATEEAPLEQKRTSTSREKPVVERWAWELGISFPANHAPRCADAAMLPEASWRKMYLSQPPCTSLYLVRRWHRSRTSAIVRENGITMGDLVDETAKATEDPDNPRWHKSYVGSDRDWHFEGSISPKTRL